MASIYFSQHQENHLIEPTTSMDMEEEQQQQQQQLHHGVIAGIERLDDPQHREERHKLIVDGYNKPPIDRQCLDHLFSFLDDTDSHEVTELKLLSVHLDPSDGGLSVLRDFFSRSDTTLTKVTLWGCDFGGTEDASQLLAAFQTNQTVSDLKIRRIRNLEGAALGNSLCGLMQNMPQLKQLDCSECALRVEGVRAFQPALQANQTVKELSIFRCYFGDEGMRLLADGLFGNATMEVLNIDFNDITSLGLADISRLLESTRLKTIYMAFNNVVFYDDDATQHFVTTLQLKQSSLQELPGMEEDDFPEGSRAATYYASIKNSLTRNQQLNRVNLLLAPPPPFQQQQPTRNSGTMMMKIWHKAMTKFALFPNNAGASAMFKLFQARPALLEKRLKRPAADAASAAAASVSQEPKRPCL